MRFLRPSSYRPGTRSAFRALSRRIRAALPAARIEEIGSSSVPGLLSKGDLDIFVGVEPGAFGKAKRALKGLGFAEKRGTHRDRSLWPFTARGLPVDAGIQLVALGSKYEFFIRFRDLLRRRPRLRAEYNRVKRGCTTLGPSAYRRVKSRFIERVLAGNPAGPIKVASARQR